MAETFVIPSIWVSNGEQLETSDEISFPRPQNDTRYLKTNNLTKSDKHLVSFTGEDWDIWIEEFDLKLEDEELNDKIASKVFISMMKGFSLKIFPSSF